MTPEPAGPPRVAMVTGGARGIGAAIVRRLERDGWRVAILDRDVDPTSTGALVEIVDVRDRAAVMQAVPSLAGRLGGLDLFVNNAGIQRHGPTEAIDWDTWKSVVDVNLHGAFNCLQAAARVMLPRGRGSIVNIVSVAAERGVPGRAPYAATKAALVGLTRCAAVEWAARGVRVNAVGPGYVDTGVLREAVEQGRLDEGEILSRIPARRLADADEVAATVSFLASDEAAYLTGQTLYVDGGFLVDYGIGTTAVPARRP